MSGVRGGWCVDRGGRLRFIKVATQIAPPIEPPLARSRPRGSRGSFLRRAAHQLRIGPCGASLVGIRTAGNRPMSTNWRHAASGRAGLHTPPELRCNIINSQDVKPAPVTGFCIPLVSSQYSMDCEPAHTRPFPFSHRVSSQSGFLIIVTIVMTVMVLLGSLCELRPRDPHPPPAIVERPWMPIQMCWCISKQRRTRTQPSPQKSPWYSASRSRACWCSRFLLTSPTAAQ